MDPTVLLKHQQKTINSTREKKLYFDVRDHSNRPMRDTELATPLHSESLLRKASVNSL